MGYVQTTGTFNSGGSSIVIPLTNLPSVGNTLVACIDDPTDPGGTVSSVSDPRGNTWTMDQGVVGAYASANTWRADVATAYQAGDSVTFAMTSSSGNSCGAIIEVAGIRGTTVDQEASTGGNNSSGSCSVTTTNSGDFLVSMIGQPASRTITAPSGWSDLGLGSIMDMDIAVYEPGATGTFAATWSWTPASPGTRYAIGEVAYFPGAGGTQYNQSLTAVFEPTATIRKMVGIRLTAGLDAAASLARKISHLLTAVLDASTSLTKRTTKTLAATIGSTGTLAHRAVLIFHQALTASVTFTTSLSHSFAAVIKQALTAAFTASANLTRRTGISLVATMRPVATLRRGAHKALTAALTVVGRTTKLTSRTLAAILRPVGKLIGRKGLATSPGRAQNLSRAVTRVQSIIRPVSRVESISRAVTRVQNGRRRTWPR